MNLKYTEDPIRVAIYARVSSDAQDVNNSVAAQISECELYASRNHMAVVAIYIEEPESGRSDDRPQFQQMVADATAKDKPFAIILVWKFSRFSRSRVDNAIYKGRLKKRGIRIISIKEPTDDSPAGQFMESIIEDVDAFYSANLSQEVRRGQRKVAERGYYPGNKAPYGYNLEKVREDDGNAFHNIFVIDPATWPIVRRIFDEAIAGRTYTDIRTGLNQDGVPPPKPKNQKETRSEKWSDSTLYDVIHNLQYAGFIVWGVNSQSGEPPVIAPGRHAHIVSKDEFDLAGRVMASKAPKIVHARQTGSVYMMSELLKCKICGKNLIVRPSKNQTSRYYQCRTRLKDSIEVCNCPNLNIKKFEERFLAVVLDDILCDSNVQTAIDKMSEELSTPYEEQQAHLLSVDDELLDLQKRQARIMEAYEKGAYSVDDYSRRITPLRESEAELRRKRSETAREVDHRAAILTEPREVLKFTSQVADLIRNSDPKDRKQLLRRFIKCVWIEPGKATVVYRIPLPKDAKRPQATELVLALDEPVPPTVRLTPLKRGSLKSAYSRARSSSRHENEPSPTKNLPAPSKMQRDPIIRKLLKAIQPPDARKNRSDAWRQNHRIPREAPPRNLPTRKPANRTARIPSY